MFTSYLGEGWITAGQGRAKEEERFLLPPFSSSAQRKGIFFARADAWSSVSLFLDGSWKKSVERQAWDNRARWMLAWRKGFNRALCEDVGFTWMCKWRVNFHFLREDDSSAILTFAGGIKMLFFYKKCLNQEYIPSINICWASHLHNNHEIKTETYYNRDPQSIKFL